MNLEVVNKHLHKVFAAEGNDHTSESGFGSMNESPAVLTKSTKVRTELNES